MTGLIKTVPSVSVSYAKNGATTKVNALGMRPMQERAYERRGEQYLLIKSPPASGNTSTSCKSPPGVWNVRAKVVFAPSRRLSTSTRTSCEKRECSQPGSPSTVPTPPGVAHGSKPKIPAASRSPRPRQTR